MLTVARSGSPVRRVCSKDEAVVSWSKVEALTRCTGPFILWQIIDIHVILHQHVTDLRWRLRELLATQFPVGAEMPHQIQGISATHLGLDVDYVPIDEFSCKDNQFRLLIT